MISLVGTPLAIPDSPYMTSKLIPLMTLVQKPANSQDNMVWLVVSRLSVHVSVKFSLKYRTIVLLHVT
jgi:hypothetical protein